MELRYSMGVKFNLFKCDWLNPALGQKVDKFNFTDVNFKRLLYQGNLISDEPFIFSSQAEKVLYVPDPIDPDWSVAVTMKDRGPFNTSTLATCPPAEPYGFQQLNTTEDTNNIADECVRTDVPAIMIIDDANDDHIVAADEDENDDFILDDEDTGYVDVFEGEDIDEVDEDEDVGDDDEDDDDDDDEEGDDGDDGDDGDE